MAYTPENNPYIPGDPYSYDLKWQVQHIKYLQGRIDDLDAAVQNATDQAIISEGHATGTANGEAVGPDSPFYENNSEYFSEVSEAEALVSEGHARGTQNGAAVDPSSPYYENNSKYFSEVSDAEALVSEGYAKGTQNGAAVGSGSPYYENNSKYFSNQSAASAAEAADYAAHIADPVAGLVTGWLADHITQPTTPAIDTSLMIAGAAADSKAAGDAINERLENYIDIYTHPGGYTPSGAAWYTYSDIVLKKGATYKLTFSTELTFSGSLALFDAFGEVTAVYSVQDGDVITVTPAVDVRILMFDVPYGTVTDQPNCKYYNSTDPLNVGDMITLEPGWDRTNLAFNIDIQRVYTLEELEAQELSRLSDYLKNTADIYKHIGGYTLNTAGWFTYYDIVLKAGRTYKITIGKEEPCNGYIALYDDDMEVTDVYPVGQGDVLVITPVVNVRTIMKNIPYGTTTAQPVCRLYNYSGNLNVGDTITLQAGWAFTTFTFNIDIQRVYTLNEIVDKQLVVVDINGKGDYTSLAVAVASEPENTTIIVKPGIYDGSVRAFHKRLNVIGTDKSSCIIRNTDGYYANPPLECSCGYLENLTFYAQYINGVSSEIGNNSGAYAIHCENAAPPEYAQNDSLTIVNCDLISDFSPALGVGAFKNWKLELDNCRLTANQETRGVYISDGTLGALFIHDMNGETGNADILVHNCIIENISNENTMCLYDLNRAGAQLNFEFIGNTLYSVVNKFATSIWWRGITTPFTNHFTLEDISNGNTDATLNS